MDRFYIIRLLSSEKNFIVSCKASVLDSCGLDLDVWNDDIMMILVVLCCYCDEIRSWIICVMPVLVISSGEVVFCFFRGETEGCLVFGYDKWFDLTYIISLQNTFALLTIFIWAWQQHKFLKEFDGIFNAKVFVLGFRDEYFVLIALLCSWFSFVAVGKQCCGSVKLSLSCVTHNIYFSLRFSLVVFYWLEGEA